MKAEDILTFLNGRLIGELRITHKKESITIWTAGDVTEFGYTIEDAVINFINDYDIDYKKEIECGVEGNDEKD